MEELNMSQAVKNEFYDLKKKTMELHGLIKRLQAEARSDVNMMNHVSIMTEVEVLRKACYQDLNTLQLLGLQFMNKLQYGAVSRVIQGLKKEIE